MTIGRKLVISRKKEKESDKKDYKRGHAKKDV